MTDSANVLISRVIVYDKLFAVAISSGKQTLFRRRQQ